MGDVDLSHMTPQLFVVGALFIILIFSMFSMAVVRFFQTKPRSGAVYAVCGAAFAVMFTIVINAFFV